MAVQGSECSQSGGRFLVLLSAPSLRACSARAPHPSLPACICLRARQGRARARASPPQAAKAFADPSKGGAVESLGGEGGTVLFSTAKGESHTFKQGLKHMYRRLRGQFKVRKLPRALCRGFHSSAALAAGLVA